MPRERKADTLAADLLGRIVSGELSVGTLLPREQDLAEAYGVNRSVVREAVKQLEVHRLVEPVRRRGTVVLEPLSSLTPEVVRTMLVPGGRRIEESVLASLLELRAGLDEQMNALAAARHRPEDLRAIEEAVAHIEPSRASPPRFAAAFEGLTQAMARATGNPLFLMLLAWQRHIFRDLDGLFLLVRQPSDAHLQGLHALLEALRRRDAELARELARAFHAYATPILLQAVRSATAPTARTTAHPAAPRPKRAAAGLRPASPPPPPRRRR